MGMRGCSGCGWNTRSTAVWVSRPQPEFPYTMYRSRRCTALLMMTSRASNEEIKCCATATHRTLTVVAKNILMQQKSELISVLLCNKLQLMMPEDVSAKRSMFRGSKSIQSNNNGDQYVNCSKSLNSSVAIRNLASGGPDFVEYNGKRQWFLSTFT